MGGVFSCCTNEHKEHSEDITPLISKEPTSLKLDTPDRSKYYQSIVENARKSYISNASVNRAPSVDNPKIEALRESLKTMTVDIPSLKSSNLLLPNSLGNDKQSVLKKSVVDVLSDGVSCTDIDNIADEIAEIVSKHSYNMRVDDNETAVVVLTSAA